MPPKYPAYDSKDVSRVQLLGYHFGTGDTESPFNHRFGPWALLPYIDVFSEDVKKMLYKKNIIMKLVPIFAKQTRVSNLLNKLIGATIFQPENKKGMIEELADALTEEVESRKTLYSRIEETERGLQQAGRAFQGVARSYETGADRLNFKQANITPGTVISIEGVLNRVSAISHDKITQNLLSNAGAHWLISDDPFFSMGQDNELYMGDPIALRFPAGLLEAASSNPPFSPQFDWYPYVNVVGAFHENWSARAPGIKTLEVRWIRIRWPRDFNDHLEEELEQSFQQMSFRRGYRRGPFYELTDKIDCLYALYLLMFTYAYRGGTFVQFSQRCATLSNRLRTTLTSIPPDLAQYFGW